MIKRTFLSFILILLCLTFLGRSFAVPVTGLYQAIVPVADQSLRAREKALPEALIGVLVKVGGDPSVVLNPAIQTHLGQAKQMMQQYTYLPVGLGSSGSRLQVSFDPVQVRELLRKMHQAIWGTQRPLLVTWIVLEQNQQAVLLDPDNQLIHLLMQAAQKRGLPVVMPIMDLMDLKHQISVDMVRNQQWSMLMETVARYGSRAALTGTLELMPNQTWQAHWALSLFEQPLSWTTQGDTAQKVIQSGIDQIANTLAAHFAVLDKTVDQPKLLIRIRDIDKTEQYAKVVRYLKALDVVRGLQLVSVSGKQVVFSLKIGSSVSALIQAIAMGSLLKLQQKAYQTNELTYRLARKI